ncbi:MAG: hypothetical protein ABIS59_01105, partial [Candidatus Saccharibacteria bacterium]
MLAIVGFIFSGLCFTIFASTLRRIVAKKTGLSLDTFAFAFYSIGIAFLIWAIAAGTMRNDVLSESVILGEGLIAAGTIALLSLLVRKNANLIIALAGIGAGALLIIRYLYFYPTPVMTDGVVVFNVPAKVLLILGAVIAAIWLPASMKVARSITAAIGQPSMSQLYGAIYTTATLAAIFFISARRPFTVILSFATLTIMF